MYSISNSSDAASGMWRSLNPVGLNTALIAFCFLFASVVHAQVISGRVVAVADGDTLTVLDSSNRQHKIRLSGIDAPESAQAFGARSKQSLSDLSFGKDVTVETSKVDRYGRRIGKVLHQGIDINRVQIERGFAWFYVAYQSEQSTSDRQLYAAAQQRARNGHFGLWIDSDPIAPWDYRKKRR